MPVEGSPWVIGHISVLPMCANVSALLLVELPKGRVVAVMSPACAKTRSHRYKHEQSWARASRGVGHDS